MSSSSVTTGISLVPSRPSYAQSLFQLHAQLAIAAGGTPSSTMAPDSYVSAAPVAPAVLAPQNLLDDARTLWERLRNMVVDLLKPLVPAKPAAPATGGPTVRRGSDGEAVKAVQQRLQQLGFDPGPLDGDFGPQTEAAVKAFQRQQGLDVDGIVGPETWAKLGILVAAPVTPAPSNGSLAKVTPEQLAQFGANDKAAFFAALRPAAEEAERQYGVPAAVTLAQAALESGWAQHGIGGYNIFGIKGTGPAGTKAVETKEWENGRYVTITAHFALYHDYCEAMVAHGKLFHNGYYDKAINAYKSDPSPFTFIRNIQGIYATDPEYSKKITSIIKTYGLA